MTPLEKIIREEIIRHEVISFARFMELALYHGEHGYYERSAGGVGRGGDFYTSVSVGGLFGELLAVQIVDWLSEIPAKQLRIVEAGAHDGKLAVDILTFIAARRPEIMHQLEYAILEPSARRQRWQADRLEKFAGLVHWYEDFSALPPNGVDGVIISNELLDAFPVHRIGWDAGAKCWFEWGVGAADGRLVWTKIPDEAGVWPAQLQTAGFDLPPELTEVLPSDFTLEISPGAADWWQRAARSLRHGRLAAIDYGMGAEQFLTPQRAHGTARAYSRHRLSNDLLASPGEQDITAHVNFTRLQRAGETTGLVTETLCSQTRFLTRIAEKHIGSECVLGPWTPGHVRQFQTLTHPEHLGRPFQVLVQARKS